MSSTLAIQLRHLTRRSVVRMLRDPGRMAPPLVIPPILFAVIAGGLPAATEIPGFPTDSFTTFAVTIMFAQGGMLAIGNVGQAVASDVESGFFDRLALTPAPSGMLLASQLACAVVLGVVQAVLYLCIGLAVGAHVEAGVGGVLVLFLLFLTAVVGFGAFGIFVGLWTGSGQAVQAIAPVALVFLFLSSLNFPRNLIESDWFRAIATVNPVSYLVEGMRSLLIAGWDAQALALGFLVALGTVAVMLTAATAALSRRVVRT